MLDREETAVEEHDPAEQSQGHQAVPSGALVEVEDLATVEELYTKRVLMHTHK